MTEFDTVTENAALKDVIIKRIQAEHDISFRDFMAMVLYHPALGYYTSRRDPIGREADYVTSPELSPLFGAMIGRQLREMWERLGSAPVFDVVEAGAGCGVLARDILAWARRAAPPLFAALHYAIVEPHAAAMYRQREHLSAEGLVPKVSWAAEIPLDVSGCIFSNELLDAMPVHRVAVENAKLREIHVTWDGTRFTEELRKPDPPVAAYFKRLKLLPGEGCRAEVNLGALAWIREAFASLTRGFLMTIDYGYEAAELYASWRQDGTLLCFYRQNPSADPYARIGRQDMTAHVDFTSIRRAGEAAGLATLGLVTQSQFLANLGLAEALQPPPEAAGLEEYAARRRAVTELLDPAGLGRLRVLVQAKSVTDSSLTGLASAADG
ncbi:MAG: SAM-dependent methyltransferase [Chloroflexota bacterium]|nr:SAM-dependent methyltransferase [Chloroflexota bacterium]